MTVETLELPWKPSSIGKRMRGKEYDRHFKDTVTVAPLSEKERELNRRLQEYALSAGISFISNDVLLDEITGVHFCYPASEKSNVRRNIVN